MPEPTNKKLYEEVKKRFMQSTQNTQPIVVDCWYKSIKNVVAVIVGISQRGVWADGLKRSGEISVGK